MERTAGGGPACGTDAARLPADIVVCCTGMWGPRLLRMVGRTLALLPLAHQYARTGPIPALAAQRGETGGPHPILRHQEQDLYYREHGDRVGIGYYGHRPMPVRPDDIGAWRDPAEPMPSIHPFTPEDFAPAWRLSRELLPDLAHAEVEEGLNGLFSFTPDNMPLVGEVDGVPGLWTAEAVWITHSAGVARAVAERIATGTSTFDLHACDINRFQAHQLSPAYITDRGMQNFVEVYDALHPLQPMAEPRPLRLSPFHTRQRELGAYFLEASGWERPQWYEANAELARGRHIATPGPWASHFWSPIVGAEAQATREGVALYDMSSLMRLEVAGPGAAAYLERMTTGRVDRAAGAVTYCLMLDAQGRLRGDITVARISEDVFQLGVNSPLDLAWLRGHSPADGTVQVRDLTPGTTCVGLWGPLARDLLQPLADHDLTNAGLRYFRCARFHVGHVPVLAMRVSYVGELGWELYTTADLGMRLWDTLWQAGRPHGVIAAGRGAFNSLRLEKGYRAFGADMTDEHDPREAGLEFAVRKDKGDYLGRAAVESHAEQGPPRRRLACLTYSDPLDTPMGSEPVLGVEDGEAAIGYVTSAAWGHTLGLGIAYAWLPSEAAQPGVEVDIAYFDRRVRATVATDPLFDPGMERLRH
jgi:dimethylglycine oxidase